MTDAYQDDQQSQMRKTMDLVMLVLTDGGRERTEQEFRELFARAGLHLARVVPTKVDHCILEVVR
jgi:O-methyltransferase